MGGFGLKGFVGRVPCPHCESTDCCGVSLSGKNLVCSNKKKIVTIKQLREQAIKHDLPRYRVYKGANGWSLELMVNTDYKGTVDLYSEKGYRGTAPNLKTARQWTNDNPSPWSYYGK